MALTRGALGKEFGHALVSYGLPLGVKVIGKLLIQSYVLCPHVSQLNCLSFFFPHLLSLLLYSSFPFAGSFPFHATYILSLTPPAILRCVIYNNYMGCDCTDPTTRI